MSGGRNPVNLSDDMLPSAIPAEYLPRYDSSSKRFSGNDRSSKLSAAEEIKRIEREEQLLLDERAAMEARHKELMEKKAALESDILNKEEDKSKSTKAYDDILALEVTRRRIPFASNLSSEILLDAQIEKNLLNVSDREAAELLKLARLRQMKRKSYINLASLLFFCSMYSTAMLIQRDVLSVFDFETR